MDYSVPSRWLRLSPLEDAILNPEQAPRQRFGCLPRMVYIPHRGRVSPYDFKDRRGRRFVAAYAAVGGLGLEAHLSPHKTDMLVKELNHGNTKRKLCQVLLAQSHFEKGYLRCLLTKHLRGRSLLLIDVVIPSHVKSFIVHPNRGGTGDGFI